MRNAPGAGRSSRTWHSAPHPPPPRRCLTVAGRAGRRIVADGEPRAAEAEAFGGGMSPPAGREEPA